MSNRLTRAERLFVQRCKTNSTSGHYTPQHRRLLIHRLRKKYHLLVTDREKVLDEIDGERADIKQALHNLGYSGW